MYVGLKQPRGDGKRCVTPARAAVKETKDPTERTNVLTSQGNLIIKLKH